MSKGTVNNPQGDLNINSVYGTKGGVYVRGWAFDKDEVNTHLNIRVYIGGDENSGAEKHIIKADKKREDVYKQYPEAGYYHGFEETIKVSCVGKRMIYVYADNVGEGTGNLFLGSKEVTILDDESSISYVPEYVDNSTGKSTCVPTSIANAKVKVLEKVIGLSIKAKREGVTVKWERTSNAKGYQIQYTTDKKLERTVLILSIVFFIVL